MLTQAVLSNLRQARGVMATCLRRNLSASAVVLQKTDPIQQLFVDKIREYGKSSKANGGKMVDVTPEVEKALGNELEKIEKAYQATGVDMTKFPTFNFTDPELQKVDLGVDPAEAQAKMAKMAEAEREAEAALMGEGDGIDENTPYYNY